ncbi:hypothetical protein SERLADRAFT_384411 [Serpula lacrymans var. lacrymans S7.9]|uniref:Uncharacterized protein n=1 Tax=Serpula lacrymans var. lacrymans (strain S7.9) TaxID=578457 RepID=F8NQR7_SERL9|nr:uncharacterized protein SERLADRAFT_384411 [Serpula lacrymans var. lacrymans S7.9]EGO26143.1 hypothetical protein SERLADRAFT_384411 [Serpula lacrymans var. lacrymans S7.9]
MSRYFEIYLFSVAFEQSHAYLRLRDSKTLESVYIPKTNCTFDMDDTSVPGLPLEIGFCGLTLVEFIQVAWNQTL